MLFDAINLALLLAITFYMIIHFFNHFIHKYSKYFVLATLMIILVVLLFEISQINQIIESGHVSLALFLLVMFASTFGKKSFFYKKILLVRGDLAIIGFILLIPHGLNYLSLALYGYNFTGIIAMAIMLPLTITSFISIRKKMRPSRWKHLHRFAYIAYLMIYIHIGFDFSIRSNNPYFLFSPNSILYHILFGIYVSSKLFFLVQKKKHQSLN